MIFVTAGTQEPFDRLIKCIDNLATRLDDEIIVQCQPGNYEPKNIEIYNRIEEERYNEFLYSSDLVVAHAGMGTIIKCLETGKPLILFPRIASMGEHRTDHQMATVQNLPQVESVMVVNDEKELENLLLNRKEIFKEIKPRKLDFSDLTEYVAQFIGL